MYSKATAYAADRNEDKEDDSRRYKEYLMVFPEPRSTENYAMKNPAIASDLSQLSVCFFIKLIADQGDQFVITYAIQQEDNSILVAINPTLYLVVDGNRFRFEARNLYNDTWKHLCLTWENSQGVAKLYRDGKVIEQKTNTNSKNAIVKSGGALVLGQEQDSVAGGYDPKQTLHGRLAGVNVWDKVLSESDIAAQYTSCSIPHGSVLKWSAFKNLTHGNVTVEEP
ncbi:C-reactive protein [Stylophora pistillata]|uniref:Pentraxin family member n=1 Tax=Stylophora pistillata TaxID=50429 RepID=A0A2B4RA99_STYPI|nr:C-reactive protein [Stylophora pistillata]